MTANVATDGTTALRGIAWLSLAAIGTKVLSVANQVLLGHIASPETYAVFAIGAAALALASGFYSPAIGKSLIQSQERFHALSRDYSAFAIMLSLIGVALMGVASVVLARLYDMPALTAVILVTALSLPLTALKNIYLSALSLDLRFRTMSLTGIAQAAIYYVAILAIALAGAETLSIAAALSLSVLAQVWLLRRESPSTAIGFLIGLRRFREILWSLRWIIGTGLAFGLTQNGDYLVLGAVLPEEEFGQYYFGFLLTANLGVLLTSSVGEAALPIFAKLQRSPAELRERFHSLCGGMAFVSSLLALGLMGLLPLVAHAVWGGKWDEAALAGTAIAMTLPLRLNEAIGAAVLESQGRWRLRAVLMIADAGALMLAAAVGGLLWGLPGAAFCVAAEQGLVGLLSYAVAARRIGLALPEQAARLLRIVLPLAVGIAALGFASAQGHAFWAMPVATASALPATALALAATIAASGLCNREGMAFLAGALARRRARAA
ncbi:oligosaccharide flippase family protein [Rubellimicrobium aerolatum]|uniref:Oligosaccharide flippase family protein n=1 Tax=Rubellimicrobium aerolatum TaxID=490979 RepID=A0ABW0S9B2_9RHOB|nr:O-antigen/teichoic acid export membrane protein [Rubellimicrobium aerolatum]